MRVATELVRIAGDPDGRPRDLTEAVRSPLERRGGWVDPAPFAEQAREHGRNPRRPHAGR